MHERITRSVHVIKFVKVREHFHQHRLKCRFALAYEVHLYGEKCECVYSLHLDVFVNFIYDV